MSSLRAVTGRLFRGLLCDSVAVSVIPTVWNAVVMKASEACSVNAAGLGVHVCRRGLVLSAFLFLLVSMMCVFLM